MADDERIADEAHALLDEVQARIERERVEDARRGTAVGAGLAIAFAVIGAGAQLLLRDVLSNDILATLFGALLGIPATLLGLVIGRLVLGVLGFLGRQARPTTAQAMWNIVFLLFAIAGILLGHFWK
jgi:hypothetical protein